MFAAGQNLKALIHIDDDGFFNLTQTEAAMSHHIRTLPPPLSIFAVLQRAGHFTDTEMYQVYNTGIGFCVIVAETEGDRVMRITAEHNVGAWQIGTTLESPVRTITIKPRQLQSREDDFVFLKEPFPLWPTSPR